MNIQLENLVSIYHENTPFEHLALNNISAEFKENTYYGIIGHTGSGKSTLIQNLNGLLLPSYGRVRIGDITLKRKTKQRTIHRAKQRVGMVFQFPEHQLFEETVIKDVMFGPKNMGMSDEEAREKSAYYLKLLNIQESLFEKAPFDLSGGQMRKVAIAGILAMEPKMLILDEPTAGLDPLSHIETMQLFQKIQQDMGMTVILVTHDMNDVYEYTEEVKLLNKGNMIRQGKTEALLTNKVLLEQYNLEVPDIVRLTFDLERKGIQLAKTPRDRTEFIKLYREWRDAHAE
ncbi:energy-coupling factor transporter ATPase [Salinicoccus albus]|uniref:energy-coupling factor transporter ATPase n=1 Tax=Salinicoccus albus TaxID=418756 RepID=UPI00036F8D79|nr:energy-coupling factor transporter ATPase [Salinicoccus albus]